MKSWDWLFQPWRIAFAELYSEVLPWGSREDCCEKGLRNPVSICSGDGQQLICNTTQFFLGESPHAEFRTKELKLCFSWGLGMPSSSGSKNYWSDHFVLVSLIPWSSETKVVEGPHCQCLFSSWLWTSTFICIFVVLLLNSFCSVLVIICIYTAKQIICSTRWGINNWLELN